MVNAAWSDYFYPGTDVLKNIPGIRDAATLREYEYEQSASRIKDLQQHPIAGNFDLDHLKSIHRQLFQDVYEWAGQERTVNLSKGSSVFVDKDQISAHAEYFSNNLKKDNFLRGLPKREFAQKLAQHYADWNELHPFREGNGRATREFIGQIAQKAGYYLDQSKIDNDKQQWNTAAAKSLKGDVSEVTAIFERATRPMRAVAFETMPRSDALASHPELQDVFTVYDHARQAINARYPHNDSARELFATHLKVELVRKLDAGLRIQLPQREQDSTSPRKGPDIER